MIASYKHSGLFGFIDSDEGKKFYNIVPEEKVINLFMVVIYVFHNKLEHLSLANWRQSYKTFFSVIYDFLL